MQGASIDLARETPFALGALDVRPSTREVVLGERREVLEPRVMQVLAALARRRGEVVSRDELIAACWGGRAVGEDAINRAIAGVRRIAQTHGGFAVETVARVGYRLSVVEDTREDRRPRRLRRWAPAAAVALVAVVAAAAAGWWFAGRPATAPAPLRVAVLPFDVIGENPRAQAFADSLLDTMVGVLSAEQVEAVSRSESRALRGPGAQPEIARLGVGLLLDGDVESDGKTLKVHVHLDDARDHAALWSNVFEGPVDSAVILQTEVAHRATRLTQVAANLVGGEFRNKPRVLAEFLAAGDDMMSATNTQRALVLLRDVVAKAPESSPAHGSLAWSILFQLGKTPDAARADVDKEAQLALALDPTNSEGYDVLAANAAFAAWSEREALLRKALAIPRSDSIGQGDARWLYCQLLGEAGRARDAVAQGQLAVSLNPLSTDARENLTRALVLAGRPEEAAAAVADDRKLWGDDPFLTAADLEVSGWIDPPSRVRPLWDDPGVVSVFRSHGLYAMVPVWRGVEDAEISGDLAKKRAAASSLAAAAEQGTLWPADLVVVSLSVLGGSDIAFREADRLFSPAQLQEPAYGKLDTRSLFAPRAASLRRDPRFMALAARLGLVDYWRTSGHWPDFCAEPGLPYDCKTEAAKYPGKGRI